MSELGDGMLMAGDFAPPFPRGFVEPDPQVYQAILTATDALKNFIQKYDLETPRKKDTSSDNSNMMAGSISFLERLTEFSRLLTLARDISIKEVSGKELAIKDYEAIQELGGSFTGTLNLGFQNNYSQGDAQRMALIADAASSSDDVLELATGTPRKVFVYVNDKWGGSRITMGYVFSYYEFVRPISEGRLNDEEWKKIVYDKNAQQKLEKLRPAWYQNLVY
jgi:hypothetical protein